MKFSEYADPCPYEAGPDYKDRIGRCTLGKGHGGPCWVQYSWLHFGNPYEDIWKVTA